MPAAEQSGPDQTRQRAKTARSINGERYRNDRTSMMQSNRHIIGEKKKLLERICALEAKWGEKYRPIKTETGRDLQANLRSKIVTMKAAEID